MELVTRGIVLNEATATIVALQTNPSGGEFE
jgi:hypothetical protein